MKHSLQSKMDLSLNGDRVFNDYLIWLSNYHKNVNSLTVFIHLDKLPDLKFFRNFINNKYMYTPHSTLQELSELYIYFKHTFITCRLFQLYESLSTCDNKTYYSITPDIVTKVSVIESTPFCLTKTPFMNHGNPFKK